MINNIKTLICSGIFVSIGFAAVGDTIFENSSAYNGNLLSLGNGQQVGNEVTLGSGFYLTNFQFEYYSPDTTLNSSLGVEVRFYYNDGPLAAGYPTPGTLFYDSGWFYNTSPGDIPGGGAHDLNYTTTDLYGNFNSGLPGNLMPSDFTFTITFTNLGANTIDLPLANSTSGANYGTYWLYDNTSSQWSLLTNTVPANFVVNFQGVPEPSIFGLGAIGGALLLGLLGAKKVRQNP